jgi:signal transduction histidine kinase/ligand-binding sensor domain-containing protein
MERARKFVDYRWRGFILTGLLLVCSHSASALNPELDVRQYAHTVWRVRDGFTRGAILAIAQTPDGYMWLGTEFGLYRFDGVRAIPWHAPSGEDFLSMHVYCLLVARDGTLWVGTQSGAASWKNGELRRYPELDGQSISSFLEDRKGTIWSSGVNYRDTNLPLICAIEKADVHCYGEDGNLLRGGEIDKMYEDSKGTVWALSMSGIWRWRPGPLEFYPLPFGIDSDREWTEGIREDEGGNLLLGVAGGIRRFRDGKTEAFRLPGKLQPFTVRTMLDDRDGGFWIATYHMGLIHVHRGRVDVFGLADGLSSDRVEALYEDRENNVWVATANGLDRFRNTSAATFSLKDGLSNGEVRSVLADKDGSVWIATPGGLDRWSEGRITTYNHRDGMLNGLSPASLFQDRGRRLWLSTTNGIGYLEGNRLVPVTSSYDGRLLDIAQDSAGNIWMADQQGGLTHLSSGKLVEQISWSSLVGHKDFALSLAADPSRGGIWIGFFGGGISYFAGGKVQERYFSAEGLGAGSVTNLQVEKDGVLWAATDSGLSRMKNGRFVTIDRKSGLPCDPIHWMIRDDDGSFWLDTPCGLVRLARSEIDAWSVAVDNGRATNLVLHPRIFDNYEGVRVHEQAYRPYNPPITKSRDGRIWFVSFDGLSVIDPHHLPSNDVLPPVHIERISANGKTYDASKGLRLPPRIRDLRIDYSALSFVVPEKVRFRYELEGQDHNWREVANDREVQYSNLAPGNYLFRVIACNNSGLWNEAGDTLDFSIAPTYYQTNWFRALCVAAVLVLGWAFYRLRMHQIQRRFHAGLEARESERIRIARELHDTLLQNLNGLMIQFQAARNMLPRRPAQAAEVLDSALGASEHAITESRSAIQHLRSAMGGEEDLAQWLTAASQELARSINTSGDAPMFRLTVEGERKDLSAFTRDEVCLIMREILRNALQHARASRIEAEIRYDDGELRVRIRDDGKGIEPQILQAGGKEGHWGLRGARERAQQIGARLHFWSEIGAGTEVELLVPAVIAYQKSKGTRRLRPFRKV